MLAYTHPCYPVLLYLNPLAVTAPSYPLTIVAPNSRLVACVARLYAACGWPVGQHTVLRFSFNFFLKIVIFSEIVPSSRREWA